MLIHGKQLKRLSKVKWRADNIRVIGVAKELPPLKNYEESRESPLGWLVHLWEHLWNDCMFKLKQLSRTD